MNSRVFLIVGIVGVLILAGIVLLSGEKSGGREGPFRPGEFISPEPACENRCGDGVCQEIVCSAVGCPCAETPASCPGDCVPKQIEQQGEFIKEEPSERVVLSTDAGFSPQDLRIKAGDRVVFQNKSSRSMWPAGDIHPSHTLYPGSTIQKCATKEAGEIFDACKQIPSGQEWSFVFDKKGEWGYHDHRNPDKNGTIIVE